LQVENFAPILWGNTKTTIDEKHEMSQ